MSKDNELMNVRQSQLLDIFTSNEDKHGNDVLSMSDFFSVFIGRIENRVDSDTAWEIYDQVENLAGEIASAIKGGLDINKMGMLIADDSHFSQEIIDGLKNGIYHIGRSKEVAGNMRPAIVDANERPVKFFTLMKAADPSAVLGDIATLSMQASLQKISSQIEDIGRDVKSIIDFSRREALSNKFIYARNKIISASRARSQEELEDYLKEADTYLMEGLTNLYSDLSAQIEDLNGLNGPFVKLKAIDTLLSYINEDMQMIPRYVGLRIYLFNYRGRIEEVHGVLEDYKYQLQIMSERKIGNGKYTALETIHRNYPYDKQNLDFWLEEPPKILKAIESYETMLEQKDNPIFYIDADDEEVPE